MQRQLQDLHRELQASKLLRGSGLPEVPQGMGAVQPVGDSPSRTGGEGLGCNALEAMRAQVWSLEQAVKEVQEQLDVGMKAVIEHKAAPSLEGELHLSRKCVPAFWCKGLWCEGISGLCLRACIKHVELSSVCVQPSHNFTI